MALIDTRFEGSMVGAALSIGPGMMSPLDALLPIRDIIGRRINVTLTLDWL